MEAIIIIKQSVYKTTTSICPSPHLSPLSFPLSHAKRCPLSLPPSLASSSVACHGGCAPSKLIDSRFFQKDVPGYHGALRSRAMGDAWLAGRLLKTVIPLPMPPSWKFRIVSAKMVYAKYINVLGGGGCWSPTKLCALKTSRKLNTSQANQLLFIHSSLLLTFYHLSFILDDKVRPSSTYVTL